MALIAVILAVLALPLAVLDVRVAAVLLAAAAPLAVAAVVRQAWAGMGWAALALVVLGGALAVWELSELNRPVADAAPAAEVYDRSGTDREVVVPLTLERAPVTRLALLELEEGADPVYEGLEPQLIERPDEQGIRIIAYRHDGHVDFYDDTTLTPIRTRTAGSPARAGCTTRTPTSATPSSRRTRRGGCGSASPSPTSRAAGSQPRSTSRPPDGRCR